MCIHACIDTCIDRCTDMCISVPAKLKTTNTPDSGTAPCSSRRVYTRLEGYGHYILDWKDTALYTRLEGYRHYILDWKDMDKDDEHTRQRHGVL